MELSGLIFVALALVWAVVLIPKALRHHDELAETRSVERVSHDARVVARREAVTPRESRLVVPTVPQQRRTGATARGADALSAEPGVRTASPATAPRPAPPARMEARRRAARIAARRRRRVLSLLLVITAGITAAAVSGYLATWAPVAPLAMLVAFLVVARVTVRRDNARWDALVAAHRRSTVADDAGSGETPATESFVEATAEDAGDAADAAVMEPTAVARNEQGLAVVTGLDDTTSIPVVLADLAEEPRVDGLWDPVPVTLPTYVSKPRATRTVRTIDLSAPGVSSSGRDPQASALVAEAATATDAPSGPEQRAVGS